MNHMSTIIVKYDCKGMKREINLFNKILSFKSIFVDNVRQKFIVAYKEARIAYNTTKHQQ